MIAHKSSLKFIFFLITTLSIILVSCNKNDEASGDDTKIFSKLDVQSSHVDFKNILTENDSLNYFTYSYLYMGGGIATGDINNDGLVDLYFTGNQVSNKLYLNKGNLQFEDITDKAGVAGDDSWFTGVTMADVNGDGFLDIYCSVSGLFGPKNNLFFLNNGDGTFTEKAKQFGINDAGNTIQSSFFDYDKDGDLDLYVANYPPTPFKSPTFAYTFKMNNLEHKESDHLYRNDGGVFTDVSKEAGIENFGLSIGLTIADLNNDSWPDIYISNDFDSPDFMYINNQDNTFREVIKKSTANTSFYGMGIDVADYNNDGLLDIFQVDMDPASNRRKKANMASMNPQLYWDIVKAGFHYQNMQNTMQLNTGVTNDGNPYFVNVSRISGTSSTDWSWGPLFADLDNDGLKDLFISNGTRREINNNDYFNSIKGKGKEEFYKLSQEIPSEKVDNFVYQNIGGFEFKQANDKWGIKYEGFSNGVVYVDLDNDGDLEIVLNNIDDEAVIFENHSSTKNNYLKLRFKGSKNNTSGLGLRAYVKTSGSLQMQELTLTRGFQSSVAPELHFGLGKNTLIDELKIVWPDQKVQILNNINVNETLTLLYSSAIVAIDEAKTAKSVLFTSIKDSINFPKFKHKENSYNDFSEEILLPHRTSTFGPGLAIGDLNNDNKDDIFIGGAKSSKAGIYFQTENGFKSQNSNALDEDLGHEDLGATIFDADADGDNDLYVVSGGNEFPKNSEMLQDRLYINDGKGNLTKDENALPKMITSGSRVYHADFDKDGKEDVLVLGRLIPKNYPSPAKSYLLKNISSGSAKFKDVTAEQIPEFESLGMATSAEITDFNGDGWLDIIVVGEWMPIRVFQNIKTGFKEVSHEVGLTEDLTGWWWSIKGGDFDNDGDIDYIAGNLGLNYKYKANENETFDIYVNDFDKNNQNDIILSYYNEGEQFPVRGRECSSQQIPNIKTKFPDYESFSNATLEDVYTKEDLENALHYQVKSFASVYLENKNGKFIVHQLPKEAQLSSINQILVEDYDNDGHLDALIAGNLFWSEVETPRNDAGTGLFLKGNGKGNFTAVPAYESGFFTIGDVKDMAQVEVNGTKVAVIAKNNDLWEYISLSN
ncbi:MAG: hypothetical protein COA50_04225 [Flavobacteriaceae bacterium]|nr:MAG: hypothetical protein COA50_04225 [Flavobacteriaceae bacterium]